jgi:NOL1/NOP2/fmu family ribosome biogenesis protein
VADSKELLERLNLYYGSTYVPEGRLILKGEKLFVYSGYDTKLRTDWVGLHLANTDLSLSIEGCQIIGASAKANVVTVNKAEAKNYFDGHDLPGFGGCGPVIIRTSERVIGPGLLCQDKIQNLLPQSRRTSR